MCVGVIAGTAVSIAVALLSLVVSLYVCRRRVCR